MDARRVIVTSASDVVSLTSSDFYGCYAVSVLHIHVLRRHRRRIHSGRLIFGNAGVLTAPS